MFGRSNDGNHDWLAFVAVFVYATHATQATAFEWKPGFTRVFCACMVVLVVYMHISVNKSYIIHIISSNERTL